MNKYKITRTLKNVVKDLSNASIVQLHDNGNYPVLGPEDSLLMIDGNDNLVWVRFLGKDCEEEFNVIDLDKNEFEILLDLLLGNKVIPQKIYDYLIF